MAPSKASLAPEFRKAGILAGDSVILHSSYKSLGAVEGGPNTVIDAILESVGPEGNLLVPTFTYCLANWGVEPYDYDRTPSRTGIITETARCRPDSTRSFHPTHSVAVIGPQREALTVNHLRATPLGYGSPFARMHDRNAFICMLGTRQDTNSALHFCEVVAGLPYIHVAFTERTSTELAWFINGDAQIEYAEIREVPGCSRGFNAIEQPLRDAGVLHDVMIGPARSQVFRFKELVDAAVEMLAENPAMLLCDVSTCKICPRRRNSLRKAQA